VAKEIKYDNTCNPPLTWSLDGGMIGTISHDLATGAWTVHTCNITSGTTLALGVIWSIAEPHLWAHNTSFQVMTIGWNGWAPTIIIFEVGSILTKIKSFPIQLGEGDIKINSFSPTTNRISISALHQLFILNIQNSKCLLKEKWVFNSHCFSSDGSLFAASLMSSVHVWKYTNTNYTLWRKFPAQGWFLFKNSTLQFSPTLFSILYCSLGTLQMLHLAGPPVVADPNSHTQFAAPSRCGTYIATGCKGKSAITITNLLSQIPSQFIDTDMEIWTLALTGNILLVLDLGTIAAWRLTEEGVVDGVFGNRRAGCSDRIWTIPHQHCPGFSFEDQTVMIREKENVIHIYHTGTGKVLESTQTPSYLPHHWYTLYDMEHGIHYPHYRKLEEQSTSSEDNWPVSLTTLQEGWVKDPEGRYQLWIPVEWRKSHRGVGWLYNIMTLWLSFPGRGPVIIKF
jgi:hypothetical protein